MQKKCMHSPERAFTDKLVGCKSYSSEEGMMSGRLAVTYRTFYENNVHHPAVEVFHMEEQEHQYKEIKASQG
jgi:hypothetical protein